jgi:prepilin-type processing-associated H-X9-DG protein
MPFRYSEPAALTQASPFFTTHWSVVLAPGEQDSPKAAAVLEKLFAAYWYPLYSHVRRRGHDTEAAQDLTHGIIAKPLARPSLALADSHRGRLRTFLLASLLATAESSRCPADARADIDGARIRPSDYDISGCSHRFKHSLQQDYQNANPAVDPVGNLRGRKESWAPEPTRSIMLREYAAFPWNQQGTLEVTEWRNVSRLRKTLGIAALKSSERFAAPVLFVDGHAQQHDFAASIRNYSPALA